VHLVRSTIATESKEADGGNIVVRAEAMVRLQDSQLRTAVGSGEGRGGNISIDPEVVLLQRSAVVADAFGGPGGNITIEAQGFVADTASRVSASSAQATSGTITIQALSDLSGTVAPLPQTFAQTAALLRQRCAERLREGQVSTLVVAGRSGLPADPEGGLPSPLTAGELGTSAPAEPGQPSTAPSATRPGAPQPNNAPSLQIRGGQGRGVPPVAMDVECARGMGERQPATGSPR
jgi:large exoprotein involved in heme utilization and adhesion